MIEVKFRRTTPAPPPIERVTLELDADTARGLLALLGSIGTDQYNVIRSAASGESLADLPCGNRAPKWIYDLYTALHPLRSL